MRKGGSVRNVLRRAESHQGATFTHRPPLLGIAEPIGKPRSRHPRVADGLANVRLAGLMTALALLGWPVLPTAAQPTAPAALEVPVIHQSRERCGQAALEMVLRYYGADSSALHEGELAYDPVLRGSLITDLAAAARRAGYEALVTASTPDSLILLVASGVPPVILYQNGRSPLTVRHFGVVTAWDPARDVFTLNDGGTRPRTMGRGDLAKRWRTAGSQVLVVRRRVP